MRVQGPDIIITDSEDGYVEYLMAIEVKLTPISQQLKQEAVNNLRRYMQSMNCLSGLLVFKDRIIRVDNLFNSQGKPLPEAVISMSLLPPASGKWGKDEHLNFEEQVQSWLEALKYPSAFQTLSPSLQEILSEPVISFIRQGDIRAAGPRYLKAEKTRNAVKDSP